MLSAISLFVVAGIQGGAPITVDGTLCNPHRLMVKVADARGEQSVRSLNATVLRRLPQIGYLVVQAPEFNLQQTRRGLREMPGIEDVELDRVARIAYDPNDPLYPNQWGLQAMRVNYAWDMSLGTSDVTVAVCDTGVNRFHEDLVNKMWVNTREIPGNGIDDDQNGYVDDVNGYDFVNGDADPSDDNGHGTLCSGVVGAEQGNLLGMSGVAPHAKIMAVKVGNSSGYFYDSDTVPGYLYAADNGAKVFSCSFFSDRVSSAERDAIDYATGKGVLVVVAAGNSNSVIPYYPANHTNSLAVAAVDSSLLKASFSNFGTGIDVAAPGVSILGTSAGGGYGYYSGTSLACPNVAGLAALLWSANPAATRAQVLAAIEDTATPTIQAPFGEYTNYGMVNAEAAMNAILYGAAPRRSAVVRYLTPFGTPPKGATKQKAYVGGRGFQKPATVEIRIAGNRINPSDQQRDSFQFNLIASSSPIQIYENGALVATLNQPPSTGNYQYPMTEASTQGATLTGGFYEALNVDGSTVDCGQRGDGTMRMESVFRRVSLTGAANVRITRQYTGVTTGTETIYLYDWSSASYPYGNWVAISSGPVPLWMTSSTISVPSFERFIDVEGSVYGLVLSSADGYPTGVLHVDQLSIGK